ncbi:MAG: efflux RND transporter permease subunit, partial [Rhodobiaceae bacterium]|nr:efflux RND transporter permease subunit [Rhodobiaceae bacterium]
EAKPVLGPDATGVGWVYQYALIDKTGGHDLGQLRSLQDWFLKFELQTVEGVSEVATIGGMDKQYQVIVDPDRLRTLKIPLNLVKRAIERGNQETGGRVLEMAEAEYMVRASGYITSMQDLELIPLKVSKSGTPLLLKDVAEIRVGPQLRRGIGELNGEGEAVGGVIIMRSGENAMATIERVKAKLELLKAGLPKGVEIVTTYDRSNLIGRAVDTLQEKLIEEFLIVALVCALFLYHLRSALVVALSLPLGVGVAFWVMNTQGINANIMSLGGIAIAVGAMVDATIVMLENVHKKLEEENPSEERRWEVITNACVEVGPALFFSLLIITLSFTPIFALEAQEGRMFQPLAFTKTYAMAAATALSITIVPVLIGYFVRGKITPERNNPVNRLLLRGYRPVLALALRRPWATLAIAATLLVTAILPISQLGSEFMPDLDEGDLLYMPSAFPAVSAGKMTQILQQTNKLIASVPGVLTVYGKAGRAETATDPAPLPMIETTIQLKPRSEWRPGVTMESIKKELNDLVQVPSLTNVWIMPIKNRLDMLATGIKTPVGVKISGPDLAVIEGLGRRLETVLAKVEGTTSVYAERVTGGRFIDVDVDRRKAARFGLNIADVHAVIRVAIGGMTLGESVEGRERYPINLRYPQESRNSVQKLKELPLITPQGMEIPLGRVATITIAEGPGVIRSENARLNGWVYVDIAGRDLGSYVQEARRVVEEELDLPAGYSIGWSGQYEYMERAKERFALVGPGMLAIIILLLFLYFQNSTDVLIIMGTLPFALVGGVWLMWVLDFNMSVAVAVGFIALSGVAVEIGVLMIMYLRQELTSIQEQAQSEAREMTPNDVFEAVQHGALRRVRPITMTFAVIVAGLAPIMYGSGTGSEIMRRIAAPMVGGMISATVLALIVIPVMYLLVHQKKGTIPSQT